MDHPKTPQPKTLRKEEKTPFHGLEVVSNGESSGLHPSLRGAVAKSGENNLEERRQLPRLNLSSEQFRLSRTGKIYSVSDLSEKGMALLLLEQNNFQDFPVGILIEGTLNLRRTKYPVQARVRYLSHERVGCEFENPSAEFSDALSAFLNPEVLGAELKAIPSSENNALWYHGPSGTDLILRRASDGLFSQFILYVFSSFIQWDQDLGLSTGKVRPSPGRNETLGILRLETLLLEDDSRLDSGKLKVAKTVILSSNLPVDLKHWCVRQLEQ